MSLINQKLLSFFLILFIVASSCLHQSYGTIPDELKISFINYSNSQKIAIMGGHCKTEYINDDTIYHVFLDHWNGGSSKLFGLFPITEWDPNSEIRIYIIDSTRIIKQYSSVDIQKLNVKKFESIPTYIIDLKPDLWNRFQ